MANSLEYWKSRGELRVVEKDVERATHLRKDAHKRLAYFSRGDLQFRFEGTYEACRELLDALLLREGYKAGSHVAAIGAAKHLELLDRLQTDLMNVAREHRNRSKYYGEGLEESLAQNLIRKLQALFKELNQKWD